MSTLIAQLKHIEKPTQEQKILKVLQDRKGEWVNGQHFVRTMMITQYHARIWSLQKKGYKIVASEHTDTYGFKSYMLLSENGQTNLF